MPANQAADDAMPIVVDPEVAAMTLAMSSETMAREIWTNVQSGRIYRVLNVQGTEARRVVHYCRVGAGSPFQLAIVRFSQKYRPSTRDEIFAAFSSIARPDEDDEANVPVGFVIEPDIRHDLDRVVIYPETLQAIRVGMNKVVRAERIEQVFHLSQIEPRGHRSVLNFWGPPGTGKTLCAVAIARTLGKPLYQVDYAEIVSKYLGDTAKHIKKAFDEARRLGAVLFFDEADSLLSRRAGMDDGAPRAWAASMNQNRNVLMQELDRFDGVVIMATNMFRNFDEAFVRRIAQHVEFRLPDQGMRIGLFKLHLPCVDRLDVSDADWVQIGTQSDGLSGGDVLNVVVNTISRVSMSDDEAQWRITTVDLLSEVQSVKRAKEANQIKAARPRRDVVTGN